MTGSLIAQARPLIVTARLDRASQKYFDELRKQYFPPERNYVPAHLTICHALPGDAIDEVRVVLNQVANGKPSPSAEISGVRSLGNGVAFTIRSPGLERVRREIAAAFFGRLTRQDAQSWRPHITVQNKVTRESARELMTRLQGVFQPWTATAERLDLWYYDGGPWEFVRCFRFEIPG
jgi:2'-5' RNA ligase